MMKTLIFILSFIVSCTLVWDSLATKPNTSQQINKTAPTKTVTTTLVPKDILNPQSLTQAIITQSGNYNPATDTLLLMGTDKQKEIRIEYKNNLITYLNLGAIKSPSRDVTQAPTEIPKTQLDDVLKRIGLSPVVWKHSHTIQNIATKRNADGTVIKTMLHSSILSYTSEQGEKLNILVGKTTSAEYDTLAILYKTKTDAFRNALSSTTKQQTDNKTTTTEPLSHFGNAIASQDIQGVPDEQICSKYFPNSSSRKYSATAKFFGIPGNSDHLNENHFKNNKIIPNMEKICFTHSDYDSDGILTDDNDNAPDRPSLFDTGNAAQSASFYIHMSVAMLMPAGLFHPCYGQYGLVDNNADYDTPPHAGTLFGPPIGLYPPALTSCWIEEEIDNDPPAYLYNMSSFSASAENNWNNLVTGPHSLKVYIGNLSHGNRFTEAMFDHFFTALGHRTCVSWNFFGSLCKPNGMTVADSMALAVIGTATPDEDYNYPDENSYEHPKSMRLLFNNDCEYERGTLPGWGTQCSTDDDDDYIDLEITGSE